MIRLLNIFADTDDLEQSQIAPDIIRECDEGDIGGPFETTIEDEIVHHPDVTDIVSTRSLGMGCTLAVCVNFKGEHEPRLFARRGSPCARFIECYDSVRYTTEATEYGTTAISVRDIYSIPTTPVQLFEFRHIQNMETYEQEDDMMFHQQRAYSEEPPHIRREKVEDPPDVESALFTPAEPVVLQQSEHTIPQSVEKKHLDDNPLEIPGQMEGTSITVTDKACTEYMKYHSGLEYGDNVRSHVRSYTHRMTWGYYVEIDMMEFKMFEMWMHMSLSDTLFCMSVKAWLAEFNKNKQRYSGGYNIRDPVSVTRLDKKLTMEERQSVSEARGSCLPMGCKDGPNDLRAFLDAVFTQKDNQTEEEEQDSSEHINSSGRSTKERVNGKFSEFDQAQFMKTMCSQIANSLQTELFPLYVEKIVKESEYRMPVMMSAVCKLVSLCNGVKDLVEHITVQTRPPGCSVDIKGTDGEIHRSNGTVPVSVERIARLTSQVEEIEQSFLDNVKSFESSMFE